MSPSYRIITLACLLFSSFSLVWALAKMAQPTSTQMDLDSLSSPMPKMPYDFRSFTQLPVPKAFQAHNSFPLKSNSSHRKRKGKAALPVF